tara:strand:+ start:349 stop:645 length:297 start_codon:yes stop_codon:yes gene_type:complete
MEPPVGVSKEKLGELYVKKVWVKVKKLLPPSTKMLLDQQAEFQMLVEKDYRVGIETDLAVISISPNWGTMVASRIDIIEKAFYDVRGIETEVILVKND